MSSIVSKLEKLARKAKAHAPSAARGVLDRLEAAYHARRAGATAPSDAAPTSQTPSTPSPTAPPKPAAINWELRSQAELIDHIEQHHHAGLRRELPLLIDAARAVERQHAGHASVPSGLSDVLAELFGALDSHMSKEEHVLFPRLRTGARGGDLDMPMRMMERDHDDHAEGLERIRALTQDLSAPADASAAWTELYERLTALEADLRQHIYLENNVLFARASGSGNDW